MGPPLSRNQIYDMWCGQLEGDRAPQVLISEVQDGSQEGFQDRGVCEIFFHVLLVPPSPYLYDLPGLSSVQGFQAAS